MANLLSRYAECIVWMARYMERVENTARILEVTETFARDKGAHNWLSVVQINADEKAFFAKHTVADAQSVLDFYLLDASNPTSIQAYVQAARENARTLRSLVSIELWTQLNVFHNRIRQLTKEDIATPRLSKLCAEIRKACQEHTGIVEGSVNRDEAWFFYSLGRYIERADQTTRLLDIKYHLLLPKADDVGSALDLSQWNALLRAVAGYQTFRRLYFGRMTPAAVAGFLLFSDTFPRSVSLCLRQVEWILSQLRSRYNLSGAAAAMERLDEIRAALADQTVDDVIRHGLHDFLDWIQVQLGLVTADIGQAFFGHKAA
ncbi:alpha-E domain-containing protein [Azospirillum sp.]|uniref:alpha-E domain-containing protein n=1 Tax=Azospirillum sp. TaxID=34012 RepID=UPI002D4B6756|nr:alpha-E domain-containing protein [Azospirillum sp.]HYD68103.1 alpha-E domain-containing protein [Azospirillum sp.]